MKYIRTEDENGMSEIFVFPRSVNHDCMAEVLNSIKNQTHSPWHRVRRFPVSAGFVNSKNECYGESFTLGIQSIPEEDTELLRRQLNQ